ncbi:MAG: SpoIIE family protein phosphatase [Candidatus Riflebacteria bacterium]
MSRQRKTRDYFLIDENNLSIFPKPDSTLEKDLLLNLEKVKKITPPEALFSSTHQFVYRRLQSGLWASSVIHKNFIAGQENNLKKKFAKSTASLMLMLFLIYCYLLVHSNPFDSVNFRLMSAFAYTVAIPVMIFSSIGFDYVSQKEYRSEVDAGQNLLKVLDRFDAGFEFYLKKLAREIAMEVENESLFSSSLQIRSESIHKLAKKLRAKYGTMALLVIDREGNNLLPRSMSEVISDQSILKTVTQDLLDYLNNRSLSNAVPEIKITDSSILSYGFSNRSIRRFSLGSKQLLYYMHTMRKSNMEKYSGCLHILWDPEILIKEYFQQHSRHYGKDRMSFSLYLPESSAIIGNKFAPDEVAAVFERAEQAGIQVAKLQNEGLPLLFTAFKGPNLFEAIAGVAVDYREITSETDALKRRLKQILTLTMLFSLCLYLLLHQQIIFPVKDLSFGVEKVRSADYSYRIKNNYRNELGKLALSINQTLENLQELEIAKVVQEALLPENRPDLPGVEVYAGTLPVNKLGGDYYDYFINSHGNLVILIADVAGHGVQAAMMMAMARSAMILGQKENLGTYELMDCLNDTFRQLRQSRIKTMATCQLLEISENSSIISVLNAGHCSPAVIKQSDRSVSFLRCKAFPLGFGENRSFFELKVEFPATDTFALYTDGFIESTNSQNQILGEENFAEWLKDCFDENLETYHRKMFQKYSEWRTVQEDDISMVLVRRAKSCSR